MILLTFTTMLWCSDFAAAALAHHQGNKLLEEIRNVGSGEELGRKTIETEANLDRETLMREMTLQTSYWKSVVPNGIMIQLNNNSLYLARYLGAFMGGVQPPEDIDKNFRINVPFNILAEAAKDVSTLLRMKPFTVSMGSSRAKMTFQSSKNPEDFLFRAGDGKLYYLLHPVPVDAPSSSDRDDDYVELVDSYAEKPWVSYSDLPQQ